MSKFFETLNKKEVKCRACARNCSLSEGQVGYCGVRLNNGGAVELLNYGKFVFLKKRQNTLYVGGIGSNMRLSFDMNWDTALLPYLWTKEYGRSKTNAFIKNLGYEFSPDELQKYAIGKGCDRIVFTYNEPLVFIEYVAEIVRSKEIDIGLVSTGYFTEEFFDYVLPLLTTLDVVFYSTFDKFYFKHGRVQLQVIKKNILKLYDSEANFRIICPLIEGENDSEDNIQNIAAFVSELSNQIPLVFEKYYPSYRMVDKSVTEQGVLDKARDIALKTGLQNVILYN